MRGRETAPSGAVLVLSLFDKLGMPRVEGRNLHGLTQEDLPLLAEAMAVCIRKQGRVTLTDAGDRRCVTLSGTGFRIHVLDKDWLKIIPFLKNSRLDPCIYPLTGGTIAVGPFDPAWSAMRDDEFRERILYILMSLFPRKFPTNPI